jgi:haloalkane dehalogenase
LARRTARAPARANQTGAHVSHVPPLQPSPELFPFRSKWFDAREGRVHYLDEGEGPPILFLHGNPTWSFVYRGIVIRLRKRFRCIALDYPGFGLSEHPEDYDYTPREHADVVLQLVRHLDLKDMTIFGHEWGGPIGMKVALDETTRLRSLVMGNTWYWPANTWQLKALSYVMSGGPVEHFIVERNLLVERLIPLGTKLDIAPQVLDHYRDVLPTPESRIGAAELPKQILTAAFWLGEIAHAVPRVLGNVPLLLTWGMHDPIYTPRLIDHFRQDFKNVKVKRLDARHFIQEDAPAEISEAVETFLK